MPSGHPEGYIEAFAQVYRDIADLITETDEGAAPSAGVPRPLKSQTAHAGLPMRRRLRVISNEWHGVQSVYPRANEWT